MNNSRICTVCKIEKDFSKFYKDFRKKDGVRSNCIECYLKKYPHKITEKTKISGIKYRNSTKGILQTLLNAAKYRAEKYKLDFNLDKKWLKEKLDKGVCELSGIKFQREKISEYKSNPFTASIDKIIPSLGYTKDNCRVICFCINMARSDWGDDVLYYMCENLIKNKNINKTLINTDTNNTLKT